MVKTLHFHCRGHRFDPWLGKFHIPHDVAGKKKKKRTKMHPGGASEEIWMGHCCGLNCVSRKICMFKSEPPVPQNVSAFGDGPLT